MAGQEFFDKLDYYINAWIPARDFVKEAMDKRFEVDASGAILVFNQVSNSTPAHHTLLIL